MEAHELAEKFRNTKQSKESFEEIIAWCSENADRMNLSDPDQDFLYRMSTKYIMSSQKVSHLDKKDATVLIHYLSKTFAKRLGIDEQITVKILEDGKANCLETSEGISEIEYTSEVIDNLTSNNTEKLLRGLQTIFHEVVHAKQNKVISQSLETSSPTKNTWVMALEKVARKANSKFYNANYTHLFRENQAEKLGLQEALRSIRQYNPQLHKLYNPELMKGRIDNYDRNFTDAKMMMDGKKFDPLLQEDTLCSLYIMEHPDFLEKYPVLQLGFNLDGSKKDITQLLNDRNAMLKSGRTQEEVDKLYETIINRRNATIGNLKGTNAELQMLDDYIKETGTDDDFVFSLIQYRLENKTKLTQEQISNVMKQKYALAAKVRTQKGEQEFPPEEQESIRDEVGDEDKPKTQTQQQDEQQAEAIWMHRLQTNNDNVAKMQDGAKKQQDVVKLIQDLDREHRQDRNQQIQEENQNNGQGR